MAFSSSISAVQNALGCLRGALWYYNLNIERIVGVLMEVTRNIADNLMLSNFGKSRNVSTRLAILDIILVSMASINA